MRERRTFAERTRIFSSDKTLRKYFLIYEGSDTEAQYFETVNIMREDIGINPLIELVPIIRSYSEEGWSNPKKILNRMLENLEESRTNSISYETLLNRMMDYFYESEIINPRVTSKRRYVEQELRRILPGYEKSSYNTKEVVMRIDKAVENEKKFCEDVEELENKVGSNLGVLIREMKSQIHE